MRMNRERIMALMWILLGLVLSAWSATFPFGSISDPGPAVLPLGCCLIFVVLGVVLLVQARDRQGASGIIRTPGLLPQGKALKRVGLTSIGMLLPAVLLERLGYVPTVFLLVLFLMRAIDPKGWKLSIFYALSCSMGSFVVFKLILKTTLPEGFFGF